MGSDTFERTGMTKTMLIFGHGYTAGFLSPQLLADGWRVIGTTRSADKADALAALGVEPVIWPGTDADAAIASATHILQSMAPGENGDPVLNACAGDISTAPDLEWLGYLSTTAVYGDHQGGWVDESTPLTPATRRGQWRVEAEEAWTKLATDHNLPLHIFRLAGIYGPGRGPFAKVRAGTARQIVKPGQVFSRIHATDIAQTLVASIRHPNPGAVYNLCDDVAAPPQDVLAYAAGLLGTELPAAEDFDTAQMSPMARSFYAESKRVRNDRIKDELGVRLAYPDYKSGLDALLADESED